MSRDRARSHFAGRRAKQAGNAFEDYLRGHHELAQARGILAHVDKIDPPAVVRSGRVEFGARTVSDWIGMLVGGRYLAVEQKSTLQAYLPRSELTDKQQKHLEVVAHSGGLALLAVEFRARPVGEARDVPPRRYVVPWLEVPWQVLRTAESVAETAIHKWLIGSACYLEAFQAADLAAASTTFSRKRVFPRE